MSSCMSQNEVADFMFLPTYSPDYNPIEEAFHQVKSYLKRHYPSASRIVGGRRETLKKTCMAHGEVREDYWTKV